MESQWDLDLVLEHCCSRLHNEDLLPPYNSAGDFDWLDEKVDLSAWTELDFPNELARGTLGDEPTSACSSPFFGPKLGSQPPPDSPRSLSWSGDPFSPSFPSPPESPANGSPFVAPEGSQLEEFHFSFADTLVEDVGRRTPSPGTGFSPPPTPVHYVNTRKASEPIPDFKALPQGDAALRLLVKQPAYDLQLLAPVPSQPIASTVDGTADASPQTVIYAEETADVSPPVGVCPEEESEDVFDVELVIIEDGPASGEHVPTEVGASEEVHVTDVAVPVEERPDKVPRKKKKRGPRKGTGQSTQKERKRLQNKNAATRYRQKKKLESKSIESEYDEQRQINSKLNGEVERVSNEISYLKGLMRELFRAQGLLK